MEELIKKIISHNNNNLMVSAALNIYESPKKMRAVMKLVEEGTPAKKALKKCIRKEMHEIKADANISDWWC